MENEVGSAARIATSVVVLVFIISIGMSLLVIGRTFLNSSLNNVEAPVNAVSDTDLYYLSAYGGAGSTTGYGKPVPVANILRWCLQNNNEGNLQELTIYTRKDTGNPNDWEAAYTFEKDVPTDSIVAADVFGPYMGNKAYVSWEHDAVSDFYTMEVYID